MPFLNSLCHLAYITISYSNEIHIPNIYAMYRVYLGVLEAKLEHIKRQYPLVARNADSTLPYLHNATTLSIAQSLTVAPEPIKAILNAVVKTEDRIFIPAVSTTTHDVFY